MHASELVPTEESKTHSTVGWVRTFSGDTIPYQAVVSNILAAGMAAISLATCDFLLEKADPTKVYYDIIGAILRVFVPFEKLPRHLV